MITVIDSYTNVKNCILIYFINFCVIVLTKYIWLSTFLTDLFNKNEKQLSYRLRAGGDHNVAHEKPEGCPYKTINVRRGNAMRYLVLDHIKEKPVRTKKALLYILSKDKRRAMENIAAQWLFHKVDAYPPEERFYPLHVKPVDDLYYIPEKKVEQMVYVVNKLKKASLESVVSDVTWEESTDAEDDDDYIVDLKTDKIKDNADRCEKTLREIERFYFEMDDTGEFSSQEPPGTPTGSEKPYRSIYESQSDTRAPLFNVPPILRRTSSYPELAGKQLKTLDIQLRRKLTPFTQVNSDDEELTKSDTELYSRSQFAESHVKDLRLLKIPELKETPSSTSTDEAMDHGDLETSDSDYYETQLREKISELLGSRKKKTLPAKKVTFSGIKGIEDWSSSDEEIDLPIRKKSSSNLRKRKQSKFDTSAVGDNRSDDNIYAEADDPKPSTSSNTDYSRRPMTSEELAYHLQYINECHKKSKSNMLNSKYSAPSKSGDHKDHEPNARSYNFLGKYTRAVKSKLFAQLRVIGKILNRT